MLGCTISPFPCTGPSAGAVRLHTIIFTHSRDSCCNIMLLALLSGSALAASPLHLAQPEGIRRGPIDTQPGAWLSSRQGKAGERLKRWPRLPPEVPTSHVTTWRRRATPHATFASATCRTTLLVPGHGTECGVTSTRTQGFEITPTFLDQHTVCDAVHCWLCVLRAPGVMYDAAMLYGIHHRERLASLVLWSRHITRHSLRMSRIASWYACACR